MTSNRLIKTAQETIDNIWTTNTKIIQCLCPKAPFNLEQSKKVQTCYRCLQKYHSECFWPPQRGEDLFECPFCYLKFSLPQKEVKEILFGGYLPILKKEKVEYKINFVLDPKIKMDKTIYIEARCVKFNAKNRYEISWPDNASLSIGKMKVWQFKPLQTTSPLKRRADEAIKLDKSRLQVDNEIILEERCTSETGYKLNKKCNHLVVIMAVTDLSNQNVLAKFEKNELKVGESKEILTRSMSHQKGDILIQKISISLKCQYFGGKMKFPARSRLCNTHIQPFDLMNFINSSIHAKSSTRRWKCPICDKRAYDLVIDKYILNLMQDHPNVNQIVFTENGEPEMIQAKEESNSEEESQNEKERIIEFEKRQKCKQNIVIDIDLLSEQDRPEVNAIDPLATNQKEPEKGKTNKESLIIQSQEEKQIASKPKAFIEEAPKDRIIVQKLKYKEDGPAFNYNYNRITQNIETLEIKKIRKLNDGSLQVANSKKKEKFLGNMTFVQLSSDEDPVKNPQKAPPVPQKQKQTTFTIKKPKPTESKATEPKQKEKIYKVKQVQIPQKSQAQAKPLAVLKTKQKPVEPEKQKQKEKEKMLCPTKESRQLVISIDSEEEVQQRPKKNGVASKDTIEKLVDLKLSMDMYGKTEIIQTDTGVFDSIFAKHNYESEGQGA